MVFSSLFFLYIFLPANIILYFLARTNRVRNWIMVAFSLVFYAWGEPVWIFLLLFTAFLNWLLALVMSRNFGTPRAKYALVAAVAVDGLATLKRVYHLPIGVQLMPINPDCAPMLFTAENSGSVRILGLAVGYFRKTV